MEFVEEEFRPRFLLHSRPGAAAASSPDPALVSKPHAAACIATAALLLVSAFYSPFLSQTVGTLLVWIALSLLVAPFAPPSVTGGDIRVGVGEPLELPEPDLSPEDEERDETRKRNSSRRSRARRSEDPPLVASVPPLEKKSEQRNGEGLDKVEAEAPEEREWNEEDLEILKKQIGKHPVGTPRRWELIAEVFQGRHGVESVISTAKSLQERRPGGDDPFAQFLRQRKPLDKRTDTVDRELSVPARLDNGETKDGDGTVGGGGSWSSGEDIALLNALKAFPKDVSMRWEKIATAVPGRSKGACMRRVAELKRDFRSSKASEA